ncbi:Response regulator receiver domain-containing protein [Actinacidiphila cocklensis]|uniref:Response regulator receiver domain-containing protein n=1 Tax=Actinacidiphila cocklensis TaxID=887465 RepID=A0A9W4DVS7_9ACTN|nr:Response regulator receiver domain-containing protein [Actinacidiphila cocklensis]
MVHGTSSVVPPRHNELVSLAEQAVEELAGRLAAEALRGREGPARDGDAGEALARLQALSYILNAARNRAAQAASAAALGGAGYPDLGRAWGITRQGARRRWPGLVFATPPQPRPITDRNTRSTAVNALVPQRAYHVLLVEDDPADALLIEEALSEGGVARAIGRADDGIEALEYLRDPERPRPDLIVLDLNMPRMNGRELLAVLKEDADLCTIPVVVLTTSATPDDVSAAYQRHANAYVTKPVNLDDFLQSVRSIDQFFLETATIPVQE